MHIICWQWLLRVQNYGLEPSLNWKTYGKGEKKMVGLKIDVVGMIITGVNELAAGGAGGTVGWVCDILMLLQ